MVQLLITIKIAINRWDKIESGEEDNFSMGHTGDDVIAYNDCRLSYVDRARVA